MSSRALASARPTAEEVRRLLEARPRILVVGDVILDGWFRGESERMTREAPVPVVEVTERRYAAGGAANTAVNLAALGADVRIVGAVGADADAERLVALLEASGVDTAHLVRSAAVTTTSKSRIMGGDHVIVRVDTATTDAHRPEVLDALCSAIDAAFAGGWPSAAIVCDYGAGVLAERVHRDLVSRRSPATLCVLDAHDVRRWADLAADVITPNAAETSALIGTALRPPADRAAVIEAQAARILSASGARTAVVTLDHDGAVVVEGDRVVARTVASPAPERNASGAGDTFTAALTVALVAGWPVEAGVQVAQAAADVVVRGEGTSICSAEELVREFGAPAGAGAQPEILGHDELLERLRLDRASGCRVVFTNGCFDMLHRGHTTYLRQARQLGDVLVVAVNSDASARRLKGPERPINPVADRAAVLASLSFVDYVTVFDEDTPIGLIETIRPDFYAKGGDYSAEMLEETAAVVRSGGSVQILDYVADHSTTEVVNRIRKASGAGGGT